MLKANKYKFSEVPQRYWDFVQRYGSIYQTKPLLECMMASGRDIIIIEIEDNGVVVGGSYVLRLRKVFNIPITASTFFGPVIGDIQRYDEVFHCYTKAIRKESLVFGLTLPPHHIEAFRASRDFSRWSREDFQILYWDISGSVEDIVKQLPRGKKKVLRRARREGVAIEEIITPQQVDEFYRLHKYSLSRGEVIDLPPARVFHDIINILRPQGLAAGFLALHPATKAAIAAGILLLGMHKEAVYMAVGQDYEFRAMGATDLLWLHCVDFLKSKGFTLFDLGRMPPGDSPRVKGIRHHKLAWVGDKGQVHNSYILTGGFLGAGWYKTIKTVLKKLFIIRDMVFFLRRKPATEAENNGGNEDS